ncbi:MAG: KpsF/GutQ family sugar-phosphate isomerase [Elusimicrobia bacterium]|nr:KpsF/GutQ family sugar-phosphate isomerase [Elusimicrobiota bacterium]
MAPESFGGDLRYFNSRLFRHRRRVQAACPAFEYPSIAAGSDAVAKEVRGRGGDEARERKDPLVLAREVFKIEEEALRATRKALQKSFTKAVNLLRSIQGRIIVIGIGKSGLIGRKLAATLTSTGTISVFMHPSEALHGDLGLMSAGDAVLALSFSGESEELKTLIPHIKGLGVPVVALTGSARSRLAASADIALSVAVPREACPFNITPTASTTAMLALGDALAVALMESRGFKQEDFARLHPGGALGRRLHLKAGDIMRRGASNPVIMENKTVREALFVMTKSQSGAVSIVDSRGKLTGFFTDGDLRRTLNHGFRPAGLQPFPRPPASRVPGLGHDGYNLLETPIKRAMTKNPFTVSLDTSLNELVGIFKSRPFDNVPVVDAAGRPVGLIDERDLL